MLMQTDPKSDSVSSAAPSGYRCPHLLPCLVRLKGDYPFIGSRWEPCYTSTIPYHTIPFYREHCYPSTRPFIIRLAGGIELIHGDNVVRSRSRWWRKRCHGLWLAFIDYGRHPSKVGGWAGLGLREWIQKLSAIWFISMLCMHPIFR